MPNPKKSQARLSRKRVTPDLERHSPVVEPDAPFPAPSTTELAIIAATMGAIRCEEDNGTPYSVAAGHAIDLWQGCRAVINRREVAHKEDVIFWAKMVPGTTKGHQPFVDGVTSISLDVGIKLIVGKTRTRGKIFSDFMQAIYGRYPNRYKNTAEIEAGAAACIAELLRDGFDRKTFFGTAELFEAWEQKRKVDARDAGSLKRTEGRWGPFSFDKLLVRLKTSEADFRRFLQSTRRHLSGSAAELEANVDKIVAVYKDEEVGSKLFLELRRDFQKWVDGGAPV